MNTDQLRQPKGVSTGGQFAATTNPESTIDLVEIPIDSSGATVTINAAGDRQWKLNGRLHRVDPGHPMVGPDQSETPAWS